MSSSLIGCYIHSCASSHQRPSKITILEEEEEKEEEEDEEEEEEEEYNADQLSYADYILPIQNNPVKSW